MNKNTLVYFLDNTKFTNFHEKLIAVGFLVITFSSYGLSVFSSIVTVVIGEWNISETQVGFIGSSAMFGMMLGAISLSYLADRFGMKKLLVTSIFIYGFFIVLATFTNSGLMFGVCRFMAGVGSGGATPIVISLLTEYTPKNSKAKAVAIVMVGNQVGGIIAPLVAMWVMPNSGWKPVLWVSIIPLLLIPLFVKIIPESPLFLLKTKQEDKLEDALNKINPDYKEVIQSVPNTVNKELVTGEKPAKVSYLQLFTKRYALGTILISLMSICGLLTINGVNNWLPLVMNSNGYPLGSSLAFSVVLNMGTLVGTLIWATVIDKVGFNKMLPIIYVVGAISLFGMGIKVNTFVLYIFVALIGAFAFAAHSLLNSFVSQYYPEEIRTTGVGFSNTTGRIGGMLGPIVGGMLLTANVPMFVWFLPFAIPGLLAAVSVVIINAQKKKFEQDSIN